MSNTVGMIYWKREITQFYIFPSLKGKRLNHLPFHIHDICKLDFDAVLDLRPTEKEKPACHIWFWNLFMPEKLNPKEKIHQLVYARNENKSCCST
jgi:hypothetical protein